MSYFFIVLEQLWPHHFLKDSDSDQTNFSCQSKQTLSVLKKDSTPLQLLWMLIYWDQTRFSTSCKYSQSCCKVSILAWESMESNSSGNLRNYSFQHLTLTSFCSANHTCEILEKLIHMVWWNELQYQASQRSHVTRIKWCFRGIPGQ